MHLTVFATPGFLTLTVLAMVPASMPVMAQTSLPASAPGGAYVLAESGPTFSTLAALTFASDGSVTGTEILRTANSVQTYSLQGTFTAAADGTNTLSVTATSTEATDIDGNPLTQSENRKLIQGAPGEFVTIRSDGGVYAAGLLLAAAPAVARGTYLLAGRTIDPANTSVAVVQLDGVGNLSGQELVNSFGATTAMGLAGSYLKQPNGFETLNISTQSTDADGNPIRAVEDYAFLATQKDIRMIRTDNGPIGIVTLSQ